MLFISMLSPALSFVTITHFIQNHIWASVDKIKPSRMRGEGKSRRKTCLIERYPHQAAMPAHRKCVQRRVKSVQWEIPIQVEMASDFLLPTILSLSLTGIMVGLFSFCSLIARSHPSWLDDPGFNPGGRKVCRTLNACGSSYHIDLYVPPSCTARYYLVSRGSEHRAGIWSWPFSWAISQYPDSFNSENNFSSVRKAVFSKENEINALDAQF